MPKNSLQNPNSYRVEHATGYIEVYIDSFFPCALKRAKPLFELIDNYCEPEEKGRFYSLLLIRKAELEIEAGIVEQSPDVRKDILRWNRRAGIQMERNCLDFKKKVEVTS